FPGQVGQASDPCRRIGDFARSFFGTRDQLRQGRDAERWRDRDKHRVLRYELDRQKILRLSSHAHARRPERRPLLCSARSFSPPASMVVCNTSLAATTVTASAARYRLFTEVASCANFSITSLQPVKGSLQNPRAWRGLGFPLTGLPGPHPRIRDLGILFYEHSRKHARTSARPVSKMFRALPAATPAAKDRRPQGFGRGARRWRV